MTKSKRTLLFSVCFLFLLLPLGGCGKTNIPIFPWKDTEESAVSPHANPRFRKHASLLDGTDNLYSLTLPELEKLPYNNLFAFGDKILIVGEYYYDTEEDHTEMDEEVMPLYTFLVYDPWTNHITAELLPEQIKCENYAILNEQLLVIDYAARELTLYDSNLKKAHSYHSVKILESGYLSFFAASEKNVVYACDYESHLYRMEMNGDSLSCKEISVPLYAPRIAALSPNRKTLLVSGIDQNSLKYTLSRIDVSTYKPSWSIQSQNYFFGDCNNDSVFIQQDTTLELWTYYLRDQILYFYLPDAVQIELIEDDAFVLRQETYSYEGNETDADQDAGSAALFRYGKYNSRGKFQSGFSYEYDYSSDDAVYLSPNGVYLSDCGCYFMLKHDFNSHASFLIWDTTKGSTAGDSLLYSDSQDALAARIAAQKPQDPDLDDGSEFTYGYTVTAIPDPDNYDWGELAELNERANRLEKEYGIHIYLGPEIPNRIDIYETKQCLDKELLSTSLDKLESVLSCYPRNFFSQLCFGDLKGIRIYLCGPLYGNMDNIVNEPSGFVNEINSHMVMVLDSQYNWDWDYTINHELSHMIDRRLDFRSLYVENSLYSEDTWRSCNPSGCQYLNTYANYEDSQAYRDYSEYFIDAYGTTFPTEDRAEIFGRAMADYLSEEQDKFYFKESSPIRIKMEYYSKCIRNGFNTKDWEETMAWETVLK